MSLFGPGSHIIAELEWSPTSKCNFMTSQPATLRLYGQISYSYDEWEREVD